MMRSQHIVPWVGLVTVCALAACAEESTPGGGSAGNASTAGGDDTARALVSFARETFERAPADREGLERLQGDAPVIRVSAALRFQVDGEGLRPVASEPVPRPLGVTLPLDASAPMRLATYDGELAIAISLVSADAAPVAVADGFAVYPRALTNADWLQRVDAAGVEDFVLLRAKEQVTYRVDVSRVAGLRLVGGALEFVDPGGAPRLRMTAPAVIDARGVERPVRIRIVGAAPSETPCAVDDDPRAPWGREPTAPGASECHVQLDWDERDLTYPMLVDPLWTTTANMAVARSFHAAVALPSGLVVVAGGSSASGTTAELFDPSTNTFAATGSMTASRPSAKGISLADGRVLATYNDTADVYDPTTGGWAATPALPSGHYLPGVARLADGRVLVAGGNTSAANLYDPTQDSWSAVPALPLSYNGPTATTLTTGRILVLGGYTTAARLYDPASNTWGAATPMFQARAHHTALTLPGGKVLVMGGQKMGGGSFTNECELYDPALDSWTVMAGMSDTRMFAGAALLQNGKVVVAGGWGSGNLILARAEIYDPVADFWSPVSSMSVTRHGHSMTSLAGGAVLVAGGAAIGNVPRSSAEVLKLQPEGDACLVPSECLSGFCVDGVCCATSCTSACSACTLAKKGSGQNGICGAIASSTDPDAECPDDGATTCGKSGVCNGMGACAVYAAGAACVGPICAGTSLTVGTCNGAGTCNQAVTSCSPYVCSSGTSCGTTCLLDSGCAPDAWCQAGSCAPDLIDGQGCTSPSQCDSGYCVDGVCCDSPCNGVCQACSAATKQSGVQSGVCDFAAAGSDPHAVCADDGAASCQREGQCDGAGGCRLYPSGTACGTTTCAGNAQSGFACDGIGTCFANVLLDCGQFLCVADQCLTTCSSDTDCVESAWCDAGTCTAEIALGAACATDGACGSGLCVDGVCCNDACDGQCEACDVSGGEGTCVPVSGVPRGTRPACLAAAPDEPCAALACDGVERASCAGLAGPEAQCLPPSCTDGVATQASGCDGTGSCPEPTTAPCEPYACGATACNASCEADTDCAPGAFCDASTGQCDRGAVCADAQTLRFVDGTTQDCAPYACAASACLTSCTSVLECVEPNVCGDDDTCRPFAEDHGLAGCTCRAGRVGATKEPVGGGALLLGVGLAYGRVRRRRR